ncbi:MAG: glycosyltransferase [Acidobacteriota bacterium]
MDSTKGLTMRVMHVIDSGGLYGAEQVLLSLLSEQQTPAVSAQLVSVGSPGCGEKSIEVEAHRRGLPLTSIRMLPGFNPRGTLGLLRLAREMRADVIHSHGYKGNILLGMTPRRARQAALVTTLHGWTNTGGLTKIHAYEWLDARCLSRMDAVVLVSPAQQQHRWIRRLAAGRSTLIPNGVAPPGPAHELSPAIQQFCSEGMIIGSAGRLSEEKGFEHLLQAAARLIRAGKPVRVVLAGDGPEREPLLALAAQLGIADRVMLPGYVAPIAALLARLDVFVSSSLLEGMPLVVLEAMQLARPIVATAVGGTPYALDHGKAGLLVTAADATALAEAIETLLDDSDLREQLGARARQRCAQEFSARTMADRYAELYRLVSRRP